MIFASYEDKCSKYKLVVALDEGLVCLVLNCNFLIILRKGLSHRQAFFCCHFFSHPFYFQTKSHEDSITNNCV